ncbi:hypothetical protein ACVGWG_06200, partial [Enterobacter asburiae]
WQLRLILASDVIVGWRCAYPTYDCALLPLPVGEGRGEGIRPHLPPKFDPLILFSQKRLPSICTLLIMIIIVTLIAIYKHYVTYG